MCLLITQAKNSPELHSEWISDFYSYNSDGVGVMYVEKGNLIVKKSLPKTERELLAFYDAHIKGKNCAWHLRMRTHGDIDLDNCHPYQILNKATHGIDMWLMHNGILSTGNKENPKKSDTYHYIKNFLIPMLAKNPDFAFHPAFNLVVAEHIGHSNKFVIMDSKGRMATINKDAGVYWHGMWLSNTYAWTASRLATKKPSKDKKILLNQLKDLPEIRYNYKDDYLGSYNYGYSYNGSIKVKSPLLNDEDHESSYYQDDELNQIFMEFEDAGLFKATDMNPDVVYEFIKTFDYSSYIDIAYMCLDGGLREDDYVKCIRNHQDAINMFPYLAELVKTETYDSYGVNTKNSFNTKKEKEIA